MTSVLFVCTANVCRSPLAHAYLQAQVAGECDAAERQDVTVHVDSASVDPVRRAVHPLVTKILDEQQLAPARPVSQPLTEELVDNADLIVTMTGVHAVEIAGRFRSATAKVFLLDHLAQLAAADVLDPDPAWRASLASKPRSYPAHPGVCDIDDPVSAPEATFRAIAKQIESRTAALAASLVRQ